MRRGAEGAGRAPVPGPRSGGATMNRLTILYDPHCGFCVKCRGWLIQQPKYVEMEFLPSGSSEAQRRFPELNGTLTPSALPVRA